MHTMPIICAACLRCWPRRPLASHLARSNIADDIIVAPGPDHTTAQAAESVGLGADDSRVAKSVVFVVDGILVLCAVRGCDRVSLSRLQELCAASSARLATPAEAEAATGFKPGTIGPVSPAMLPSVRIVMDERLLAAPSPVFAGAGTPGEHLRISPAELRRASGASVAQLVEPPATREQHCTQQAEPPRPVARGQAPPPLGSLASANGHGQYDAPGGTASVYDGVRSEQHAPPELDPDGPAAPEESCRPSGERCEVEGWSQHDVRSFLCIYP